MATLSSLHHDKGYAKSLQKSCKLLPKTDISALKSPATRAVLRLVWSFDGIVQKHIHKRLI